MPTQDRKIKKNIYGTPQSILITYPSGMDKIAISEIDTILKQLWFPQKYGSQISKTEKEIRVDEIHLFAVIELLLRSLCLTDIRLIIYEGPASGRAAFEKKCRAVSWDMYLNKNMSIKIKTDSVASHAFHEGGLKEILQEILQDYAVIDNENPTSTVYASLYKDRLTLSISLAGESLYKRGYRSELSASAPLREDAAASCIRSLSSFANNCKPKTILIPFAGTGTFAFEYLLFALDIMPGLLERDYALKHMPLFRDEHFHFLMKKAAVSVLPDHSFKIHCIDNAKTAVAALQQNSIQFDALSKINSKEIIDISNDDFFNLPLSIENDTFILMNPPYGIRLGKNNDTDTFYKKIATTLNKLNNKQYQITGLILCPTEASWSAFCKEIKAKKMETYHFMQGGIDVRVCNFIFS